MSAPVAVIVDAVIVFELVSSGPGWTSDGGGG